MKKIAIIIFILLVNFVYQDGYTWLIFAKDNSIKSYKLNRKENYGNIENNLILDKVIKLDFSKIALGDFSKVIINEKKEMIFILDKYKAPGVYCFNLDGVFISQIGRLGQGPGEYVNPIDFLLLSDNELAVMDYSLFRISIYDYSGNFINYYNIFKKTLFNNFLFMKKYIQFFPDSFILFNNNFLLRSTNSMDISKESKTYYLFNGGIINGGFHDVDKRLYKLRTSTKKLHKIDNNHLFFGDVWELKIFEYDEDYRLIATYYIDDQYGKKYLDLFNKGILSQNDENKILSNLERFTFIDINNELIFVQTAIPNKLIKGDGNQGGIRISLFNKETRQTLFDIVGYANITKYIPMNLQVVGSWSKGLVFAGFEMNLHTENKDIDYDNEIRLYRYKE